MPAEEPLTSETLSTSPSVEPAALESPAAFSAPELSAPIEAPDLDQSDASEIPEALDSASPAPSERPATTMQGVVPPVFQSGATVLQLPTARLLHIRTNTSITLPRGNRLAIGKPHDDHFPEVDVSGFADSDIVSRKHACIYVRADGYYLEDVGSSNGTYINDVMVGSGEQARLKPGDRISLGRENKVTFIFQTG